MPNKNGIFRDAVHNCAVELVKVVTAEIKESASVEIEKVSIKGGNAYVSYTVFLNGQEILMKTDKVKL